MGYGSTPRNHDIQIPGRGRIQSTVSIDVDRYQDEINMLEKVPEPEQIQPKEEVKAVEKAEEPDKDEHSCYNCSGTGLSSSFKACHKCKGKGLINDHLITDLKTFLHGEFEKYLE